MQVEKAAVRAAQSQAQQEAMKYSLVREMVQDGLIEDEENYRFKLSNNKLIVNGEKQPEAVFQKYKRLYLEATRNDPDEDMDFTVEVRTSGKAE